MRARLLLAAMIAASSSGCNQLFGLDAPARGDAGGGGDDDDTDDGGGGDVPDVDANPDDRDGDGVANTLDNCPDVPNPTQADEDGDAEVNGGDACDLCPHRAAPAAGAAHTDVDDDKVGDDCDPSTQTKHCLRWFDGFSDGPDTVIDRYETSAGDWKVENGELVQRSAHVNLAEATIRNRVYDRPFVATLGVPQVVAENDGDAGVAVAQNAVGVSVGSGDLVTGTCFGVVMRRTSTPTSAQVALMREGQLSEVVLFEATAPNSRLVAGERVLVSADLLTSFGSPRVVGMLPDDYPMETTATGTATCATLGGAGLRTQFAAVGFRYLYVIELQGASGCGPREP